MLVFLRDMFCPRNRKKKSQATLVGKASDLEFQCLNFNNSNGFFCPREVCRPGRKKKAIRNCWGCRFLRFTVPEIKVEREL